MDWMRNCYPEQYFLWYLAQRGTNPCEGFGSCFDSSEPERIRGTAFFFSSLVKNCWTFSACSWSSFFSSDFVILMWFVLSFCKLWNILNFQGECSELHPCFTATNRCLSWNLDNKHIILDGPILIHSWLSNHGFAFLLMQDRSCSEECCKWGFHWKGNAFTCCNQLVY